MSCVSGSSREARGWGSQAQQHVRSLLLTWCEWLHEHRSSNSSNSSSSSSSSSDPVADACDSLFSVLKGSPACSLQDCVWRLWAALILDGAGSGGAVDAVAFISGSSSLNLIVSLPEDFFLSPDAAGADASSSSAAAAAAAASSALSKTLSILSSGFASVRADGAARLRISIDTSQQGAQFASLALAICSSAGAGNAATSPYFSGFL